MLSVTSKMTPWRDRVVIPSSFTGEHITLDAEVGTLSAPG